MSDEPDDSSADDRPTSDRTTSDRTTSDGDEVEIEVTSGRIDESDEADEPTSRTDAEDGSADRGGRPRETVRTDREPLHPGDREPLHPGRETALADELGRIDVMTTPEGYVEGRIVDVASIDATTVELVVSLPHGEITAFTLEKPIPWSEEFLLARIVCDVGYDAASIDHVVGEPVYLERTNAEPDDEDWWSLSMQAAGDAVLSSLSGGRYRLEREREPEWRLVDPLERPDATSEADDGTLEELAGVGLVLLGALLAAVGAVVGATGGVVLSSAVVGYALVGLLVVLFGLAVLRRDDAAD